MTSPDRAVADAFYALALDNPWLVRAGEVGAYALHPWVFRIAVTGACVEVAGGRPRTAVVCGSVLVGGTLAGVAMKLVVARPRPVWADPVAAEIGYSMPSSHALNAGLGCGLLVVLARPWLSRQGHLRTAIGGAVVVAGVTALDRLLLGVHYLSDVGVGAGLGALLAVLANRLSGGDRLTAGST